MRRTIVALFLGWSLAAAPAIGRAQSAPNDELTALGAAIDAKPDVADGYEAYASAAFKQKAWDEAIARLKEGVAKIPSFHAGYYKLGYAYRQKHAFAESAAAYRRFAELEPGKSDPFFGLGASLQGAGDRAGAIEAYKRYVELEKTPEKQKYVEQAKAEIARLSALPAKVVAVVAPPVVAPPVVAPAPANVASAPHADALALRAEADKRRAAGKLEEASAAYERALAADPANLDLHVELGDAYFAQKRYADAAKIFRAAVERDSAYALGWYNLAHAESRAGEHRAAVSAYREYMKLRPSDPDPYYGLGQAERASGNNRNAIDALRTYIQMEKRPESQKWIERAKRELEELEGAHSLLRTRDLKNPFEEHPAYASADELLPPGGEAAHDRVAKDAADDVPAEQSKSGEAGPGLRDVQPASARERLMRYASALAEYRTLLDRQASTVAAQYQRGTERVLANDLRGAQKIWTATLAGEKAVDDARAKLERARAALTK